MWTQGTTVETVRDLNALWMHDAQLVSLEIDYAAKAAVVTLRVYEDQEAPKRALCRVAFEGVEAFNQIANITHLEENASAGNINAWRVHGLPGKTYIDLTEGCIEVQARTVCFTVIDPA